MTSVTLYIAMSLDGYIARKNGDIDWLEAYSKSATSDLGYGDFYQDIDALIMGKNTYEQVLTFGPWPYEDKPTYVFTHKEMSPQEGVYFVHGNPKDQLKDLDHHHLWLVGGAAIIQELFMIKYVKKIIVTILPLILGDGIPLFRNILPEQGLKLLGVERDGDLVQLTYEL